MALLWALMLALVGAPLIRHGADYWNYADYFEFARMVPATEALEQRFEPVFAVLVVGLTRVVASDVWVFALLMTASLLIKARVLFDLSATRTIGLVLLGYYAVRYMPLHELTQIRIALALGLWLLALRTRSLPLSMVLAAAASLTHYSTMLLVPLLLAWRGAQRANNATYRRIEVPLVLGTAVGLIVFGIVLQPALETLSLIFSILDLYSRGGFGEDSVNLFSLAVLVDVILLVLGWLVVGRDVRARFWLAMLSLSLVAFYVLADFPVLAHRIREMMSLFWLPYLAIGLSRRGHRGLPRLHAKLVLVITLPTYLYLNFIGSNALFPIDLP